MHENVRLISILFSNNYFDIQSIIRFLGVYNVDVQNTRRMAYLFYSSLQFTHVDSNFSAFRKTYTNILCIHRIFFTPCNTCKGFSIYNIRIPLSEGDRDIVYKLKKKKLHFLPGISLKPNHSDGREELTFIHCNVPCSPMVSQHHEYGFCCLPRAQTHTNTHPEIHFYTVNKITRWK